VTDNWTDERTELAQHVPRFASMTLCANNTEAKGTQQLVMGCKDATQRHKSARTPSSAPRCCSP